MLRLKKIDNCNEFGGLHDSWNELLRTSSNNSVFLTWEWMWTWWNIYRGENSLYIIVAYSERDELVGIAPLMLKAIKAYGMQVQTLQFISSGEETTPDYLNFMIKRGHEEEFVKSLFGFLKDKKTEWDIINLKDMKKDTVMLDIMNALVKGKYHYSIINSGKCVYVELPQTWETYLEMLSRKSRYNIWKKEREISKKYKIEFSVIDNNEELESTMKKLSELHAKRMYVKGVSGESVKPIFWQFHEEIAKKYSDNGWLFIGVLKLNGVIVACQYAYQYNKILFHYQSGIDPGFSKYSVGLLSNAYMIRESIKRGFKEYDFLRGNEVYKTHWAKNTRSTIELHLWNNNARACLCLVQHYCRTTCKRMMKRFGTEEQEYANQQQTFAEQGTNRIMRIMQKIF